MSLLINVDFPTPDDPRKTWVWRGRRHRRKPSSPVRVRAETVKTSVPGAIARTWAVEKRGIGAEVGLVKDDDRSGAALPDHDHLPFEPAEVEVGIQSLDEENDVDVGGQDLFLGPFSGGISGEPGPSRQDGVDDGFLLGGIVGDRDPVADLGEIGRRLGLEQKTTGDLGRALAAGGEDHVLFPVFGRYPTELESAGPEFLGLFIEMPIPSERAKSGLGRRDLGFGHGKISTRGAVKLEMVRINSLK